MKNRRSNRRNTTVILAGISSLIVIGVLGFALAIGPSQSGQAQEPTAILKLPDFPPTPTMAPVPTSGPQVAANPLSTNTFADPQALANWQIVDLEQVLKENRSVWSVKDGFLIQDRTAYAKEARIQETLAVTGDPGWTDYIVSAKFYDDGNGTAGLVARRQGNNFYRYRIIADFFSATPKQVLEKVVNGVATPLVTVEAPGYEKFTWYTLSMSVVGSKIQVRLNDKVVAEASDSTLTSGQAGLYTRALGGIRFDDVIIAAP